MKGKNNMNGEFLKNVRRDLEEKKNERERMSKLFVKKVLIKNILILKMIVK